MYYVVELLEKAAIAYEIPNEETLAAFAEVDEMKNNNNGGLYNGIRYKFHLG